MPCGAKTGLTVLRWFFTWMSGDSRWEKSYLRRKVYMINCPGDRIE
jgi:hypothetical protein